MNWKNRIFWLCCIAFLTACGSGPEQSRKQTNEQTSFSLSAKPDTTYSPAYAKGVSISYHNLQAEGKSIPLLPKLNVYRPWQGADTVLSFCLLPRKHQLSAEAKKELSQSLQATLIETPCQRVICTSTTHAPMIAALDETDKVVGYSQGQYVNQPAIRKGLDEGRIQEVGAEGTLNLERIVNLQPDLLIGFALSPENAAYQKLLELDVPVLTFSEWTETDPLGRAQWIEVMGLLFQKADTAQSVFRRIAERYEQIKTEAAAYEGEKPTVFQSAPFQGTWYMAAGDTYAAQLLQDAGADYLWADTEGNRTLSLDTETVYDQAAKAQFWLQPGIFGSLEALQASDERLAEFQAFRAANVWNSDKRQNAFGGSDYWETGALRPDIVLDDLTKLLKTRQGHPDSLYFYRRLPQN